MGAVNYWSKRLNHGQGPFVAAEWSTAARRERQRAGKLFLPSGDQGEERRGRREEIGGTAARTHTPVHAHRPNWWPDPKGLGVHMEGNTLPCALLHTLLF